MVEHMPTIHKTLNSIPSTVIKEEKGQVAGCQPHSFCLKLSRTSLKHLQVLKRGGYILRSTDLDILHQHTSQQQ